MKICLAVPGEPATGHPWDFFAATLAQHGVAVEIVDLSAQPIAAVVPELAARRASGELHRLVLWGVEDLALELRGLAEAGRMVIVPAPDALAVRDAGWWQQFQTHRLLALSRTLHEQLLQAGLASAQFQPYAPPIPAAALVDVTVDRSALLWEPHGSTVASVRLALRQCRALGLHRLQVAACASGEEYAQLERLCADLGGLLELAPAAPIGDLLRRHICLFAPRPGTGVNPVLLQALAAGRIMIAPDAPLLRDYIGHLATGLLYNPAAPDDLPWLENGPLRTLSAAAHAKAARGHARWQADAGRLLSVLADDDRRWSTSDRSAEFGNIIRRNAHAAAREFARRR